jgi:ankyrin repeat protein
VLKYGADVNVADGTPLILASRHNHPDVVSFLLSQGARVDAKGGAPILTAASNGHASVVKSLADNDSQYVQDAKDLARRQRQRRVFAQLESP